MARSLNETKTEITPFNLDLPPELTVEPKWKVPLPGSRTALVYIVDAKVDVTGPQATTKEYSDVVHYHVAIQRKSGIYEQADSYNRYGNGAPCAVFDKALDVQHYLQASATKYAPKKTTTRVEQDYDE